jgi:hypothetical protein
MAWKIHSWSAVEQSGSIASPHYGPWPFGESANPEGTTDFEVGEDVVVEVDGIRENQPVVRSVRRVQARKSPPGTDCSDFESLNQAGLSELRIEQRAADRLELHAYDCCDWCEPGYSVVFENVQQAKGLDLEDLDDPWFRLATEEEKQSNSAVIPAGFSAYTIVLASWSPGEQVNIFVVAEKVTVARR